MYDVGSLIDSIYGTETRAPYLGTTNSYGYTVSNFLNILYAGETESSAMVGNPVDFDDEYLSVRNAFNNQGGNSISTLVFSLIRNAGNSRLRIVDSNTHGSIPASSLALTGAAQTPPAMRSRRAPAWILR